MVVHNLPHAVAPFVNRISEIEEIIQHLNDSECRLLTLVGPGGIGKTRLAIRVATDCAEQFDDGVYFIPLQPLDSPEFIISAIAEVIGLPFSAGSDPQQQLLQYLREKALLLVLDNFEHLLDGAELLSALLEASADTKLLVTSREVLNLREEWRYPVHGLHYPKMDDSEQPGTYSAVQLFVERARQVRGDITLADEQAGIVRVCQLVEGMPLALELAAVWTNALPIAEIAIEIQRNLDFLSTSLRNVPQRHQSMQAVFEQTWRRLSEEEQRVFSALAVFSGGFRREAAKAVAGVSLRVLSDLLDKSLLACEPDGRYQIHELLRQYAEVQLEAMPEEAIRIHDLHAAYYSHFLHELDNDLNGGRQREASQEIEADIDNIRAAWSWAVEHSRIDDIDRSAHPLFRFYSIRSRFLEGANTFEKAVQILDTSDPETEICLAKALCSLGWLCARANALEKARAALERSWMLYSQYGVLPTPGQGSDPRVALGFAYLRLGRDIDGARQLAKDALRDHTLREDHFNLPMAFVLLANVARVRGDYEEAERYARQGYASTVTTGDKLIGSYCLQAWGTLSQLLGNTADAKWRFQASYAIRKDFGDLQGMAVTLNSLGRIALLEGDHAEARRCYEQAWTLYHDLGDEDGLAISLLGMGNSARYQEHYEEARRYLREGLQISSLHTHLEFQMPWFFIAIGELFLQTGQRSRGIELLTFAQLHSLSDHDTKDRAQHLLARYQASEEMELRALTKEDFNVITTALLDELQIPENSRLTRHTPQADWNLIEPLSEREFEVLTLVADELSNREIADKLFISVATVKWYLTHIYSKLGVQNRTLAIIRARQLNLLP